MTTTFKTAIAALVAFAALTGAAFADDMPTIDSGAVLENVYSAMDRTQSKTFDLVLSKAENAIEQRLAQIDPFGSPEPQAQDLVIASN
jgi:hypothetical protein